MFQPVTINANVVDIRGRPVPSASFTVTPVAANRGGAQTFSNTTSISTQTTNGVSVVPGESYTVSASAPNYALSGGALTQAVAPNYNAGGRATTYNLTLNYVFSNLTVNLQRPSGTNVLRALQVFITGGPDSPNSDTNQTTPASGGSAGRVIFSLPTGSPNYTITIPQQVIGGTTYAAGGVTRTVTLNGASTQNIVV